MSFATELLVDLIYLKLSDFLQLFAPRLCLWPSSAAYTKFPPAIGRGHPSSPLSIYFLIFSPFHFSLSFISFTYFLPLSIPSLNTWNRMILLYFTQTTPLLLHKKPTITRSILSNMNCETDTTDKSCKRFTELNFVFCYKFPLKLLYHVYLH